MRASYSTSGFMNRDLDAALDGIAGAGFRQVEIVLEKPHFQVLPEIRQFARFKSRLESHGLTGCTVHAPLGRTVLGGPTEDWRREKVIELAHCIRLAGALGAGGLVIHATPNPVFVPDADHPQIPARIRTAAIASLEELLPVAQEAGTKILLENLPYVCAYPLLTLRELRGVVDPYPASILGLVIDTGHAWVLGNDPCEEIRAAGNRLGGTHLQDVALQQPEDSHWVPTRGGLDWEAIRHELAEIKYNGGWTFEITAHEGEDADELARTARGVAAAWGL